MKQIITIFIFMTFITTGTCIAADKWTREDSLREVAALTFHFVDWKTTRGIAQDSDHYREANPILGEHPSVGRVNTYFVITTIAHPIISYYLPRPWREGFQYVTIGMSMTASTINLWSGLRVRF